MNLTLIDGTDVIGEADELAQFFVSYRRLSEARPRHTKKKKQRASNRPSSAAWNTDLAAEFYTGFTGQAVRVLDQLVTSEGAVTTDRLATIAGVTRSGLGPIVRSFHVRAEALGLSTPIVRTRGLNPSADLVPEFRAAVRAGREVSRVR